MGYDDHYRVAKDGRPLGYSTMDFAQGQSNTERERIIQVRQSGARQVGRKKEGGLTFEEKAMSPVFLADTSRDIPRFAVLSSRKCELDN